MNKICNLGESHHLQGQWTGKEGKKSIKYPKEKKEELIINVARNQ